MAILAEVFNPISREVIRTQFMAGTARDLVPRAATADEEAHKTYEAAVGDVADVIANTSSATAEIAALIPTWISVTAGIGAVLIDRIHNENVILVIGGVWIFLSGMIGIKYFSTLRYYDTAHYRINITIPIVRTLIGDQAIRLGLILINLVVIIILVISWKYQDGTSVANMDAEYNVIHGIEKRLDSAGTTLSAMQKTMEAIETRLDSAGVTLSVIPKTLEGIDAQLLDMRIAQSVDLSYLTGGDCRRVQQTLQELAGYKGRIDGICDGATDAAAREWQIQHRQTIAPARSAEEIDRRLRTLSAQSGIRGGDALPTK
jgi:hypothetical protein